VWKQLIKKELKWLFRALCLTFDFDYSSICIASSLWVLSAKKVFC
jgi:hypothetical protein